MTGRPNDPGPAALSTQQVGRPLHSMTGFGRGEADADGVRVVVDVRTANHKGLDIKVRLPRDLAEHEPAVLRMMHAHLQRGRVDVACEVEARGSARAGVDVDAVTALVAEVRSIGAQLGATHGLSEGDLLRAALQLRVDARRPNDCSSALFVAVERALQGVEAARVVEGAALHRILDERLSHIAHLARDLAERAREAPHRAAERLRARTAVLAPEVDPARLAQEIALLADRLDVTEELERLGIHVEHGRRLLDGAEPAGRKLDFLCQELLREANTAGSKLADAAATQLVVELKSEIERVREQAQNVE